MKNRLKLRSKKNNSGFIIADFLFAFTMVLGVGIFMFALTFSLATIEVGQYIVWSTARNYSAGNLTEDDANKQAVEKFNNLVAQFPLLTNSDGNSSWFELSKSDLIIGELDQKDPTFNISTADKTNSYRQPWTGVSTTINLKLFAGLQIPFLGKVNDSGDATLFKLPIRAFIIRNVSIYECKSFFYNSGNRRDHMSGTNSPLDGGKLAPGAFGVSQNTIEAGWGEDNGC